jgi:hypothetical protein
MEADEIDKLPEASFRRLTGVKKKTYFEMRDVLQAAYMLRKARGGKPNRLPVDQRLLMTLEYWREYRTYFHIGRSYGLSESAAYRNIKWCEDTLIKSGAFTLPGKKALLKSDMRYEVVLIDATESPVQRPKKLVPGPERGSSAGSTPARKNATRSRHR